jgi:predicted kinase
MLIALSGLPGTGKTTIARELVRTLLHESAAVYLRIDSIEQALRDTGLTVEGEGYSVAYAIAEDNLRLGSGFGVGGSAQRKWILCSSRVTMA